MKTAHFPFTNAKISALESVEKAVFYYDEKCNGLAVRIAKTKAFYWHGTIYGQYKRKKIAGCNEISVEQAREIATEMNAKRVRGENPIKQPQKMLTLKELFEQYLLNHVKINAKNPLKSAKSIKEETGIFKRYLGKLNNATINDISHSEMMSLHQHIGEKHGEPSANRMLSLLKSLFNRAIEWNLLDKNPCLGIRKFKELSRTRVLEKHEKKAFFNALNSEQNQDFKDIICLAILTGQRIGNIMSLRWEEINFQTQAWVIPTSKFKTRREHAVPLIQEAVELLKKRAQNGSEWVFPAKTKIGHFWRPERAWKALLERANIENLRIHDLRRTLASAQLNDGVQLHDISRILGHTNTKTTQIYAIPSLNYQRKLIQNAISELRTT